MSLNEEYILKVTIQIFQLAKIIFLDGTEDLNKPKKGK